MTSKTDDRYENVTFSVEKAQKFSTIPQCASHASNSHQVSNTTWVDQNKVIYIGKEMKHNDKSINKLAMADLAIGCPEIQEGAFHSPPHLPSAAAPCTQ